MASGKDRVVRYRLRKKLTLKELSEQTGISVSLISDIEQGYRRITLDTSKKLSSVMKCKAHSLIDWKSKVTK